MQSPHGMPMTAHSPEPTATARRTLATRDAGWAIALARWLARIGVRPNAVSIAGVAFALGASFAFFLAPEFDRGGRAALLLVAAASVQLRLLCNLLDGMLAGEGGFKSKTGEIYNDLPDRVADVLILVGAGYSVRSLAYGVTLGWAAAVLAVFVAYVRLLGGSLGVTQHFMGPMAKQHRMFTLTVVTLLAAVETLLGIPPRAIRIGLGVIVAGSIVTAIRRIRRIASEVAAR
ncbi:MAG: CDP-alcohol phosphatidyltransferase family protein [Gemmatimonadaceae bacterium]